MTTKVHRVRFYNPKPESVNCVSFNRKSKQLALARSDASIEIWDLNYAPYCIKFIPGVENGSVEALAWSNNRLLSTGLGGALVEWDLDNLTLKSTVLLTGYAAWCLDVNSENTLVAVGTEQGYLNLYSLENDEIVYKKLFDKQEGRIMCCKFYKTGNNLVTGSVDTIRVWNIDTGHATTRISVKRRGQETIVWSLAVLSDNTIVSGDSYGRLTFWDGVMGDQIESFVTHKADILAIAVDDEEKRIYCSGVDPVVISFIKVTKSEKQCGWMKHVQRNMHEHDVRALAVNGKTLVSLGVDGYITLSSFAPKWVMRIPPMVPANRSSVSVQKKLLLLRYKTHLEVWKLGEYATNNGELVFTDSNEDKQELVEEKSNLEQDTMLAVVSNAKNSDAESQILKVSENPVKLVSVQTKQNKQIVCCEISPCGEYIAYSTDECLRILKLDFDEQYNTSLTKVEVSGLVGGCRRLCWGAGGILVAAGGVGAGAKAAGVHALRVGGNSASFHYTLPAHPNLKSNSILHLIHARGASGAEYIIASDARGGVGVWRGAGPGGRLQAAGGPPARPVTPTALAITRADVLLIAYADHRLVEYDLKQLRLCAGAGSLTDATWRERRAAVVDLCPRPEVDAPGAQVVALDHAGLWLLDTQTEKDENNSPPHSKKAHRTNGDDAGASLRILPFKYLSGFHWLSGSEAVLVETPVAHIVSQLPEPVTRTKWM